MTSSRWIIKDSSGFVVWRAAATREEAMEELRFFQSIAQRGVRFRLEREGNCEMESFPEFLHDLHETLWEAEQRAKREVDEMFDGELDETANVRTI